MPAGRVPRRVHSMPPATNDGFRPGDSETMRVPFEGTALLLATGGVTAVAIGCFAIMAAWLRLRQEAPEGWWRHVFKFPIFFVATFKPGLVYEVLLVSLCASALLAVQRRSSRSAVTVLVLLLTVYTASFIKSLVLFDPLTPGDLLVLRELMASLQPVWLALGVLVAAGWTIAFIGNVAVPRRWTSLVPLVALSFLVAISLLWPQPTARVVQRLRPVVDWHKDVDVRTNGLLLTMLRKAVDARLMNRELASIDPRQEPEALGVVPVPERRPAVYFITLESFVDPRDLESAPETHALLDPEFARWLDEGRSLLLSPTFANGSARGEFEALCGIPSLGRYGIEYLRLRRPVPCLPARLREMGYRTFASQPVAPGFFGYLGAYQSMGFDQAWFDRDFDLSDRDGLWLSSQSLFAQTRSLLAAAISANVPRFVFVAVGSGHWPLELDPVRRPPVIPLDRWSHRAANASHYNSGSVVAFVESIERDDASAIIVIFGDHLPPAAVSADQYEASRFHLWQVDQPYTPFWETRLRRSRLGRGFPLAPATPHRHLRPSVLMRHEWQTGCSGRTAGCWPGACSARRWVGADSAPFDIQIEDRVLHWRV